MLRKSKSPVPMAFQRSGGSIVQARADVWKARADDWQLVASALFMDATQPSDSVDVTLPKGSYTCVFQCFVQESLNGRYAFDFTVDSQPTFADKGDVNTTPAKDDRKQFQDQFILEVK
jgi:hypothetical protein